MPKLIFSKSVSLEAKHLPFLRTREIIFTCFCNSAQFLVKGHHSFTLRWHYKKKRPLKAIYSVYLSNTLSEMHVIYINTSSLFLGKRKQVVNGNIYAKLIWNLTLSNCRLKSHTFPVSDIHPEKVNLWLQKFHCI